MCNPKRVCGLSARVKRWSKNDLKHTSMNEGLKACSAEQRAQRQQGSAQSPSAASGYDSMKIELQGLTAGLVALGVCACAIFYSKVCSSP